MQSALINPNAAQRGETKRLVKNYSSILKKDVHLPKSESQLSLKQLPRPEKSLKAEAEEFLQFELSEDRYLAQADPKRVLAALRDQGFYLQLPPKKDDDLLAN